MEVNIFVYLDRRGSLQPSGRPIDDGHLGVPGHIWNRSPSGRRASLQPGMIPNLDVPQTTSRRSSLRYFPGTVQYVKISHMNYFSDAAVKLKLVLETQDVIQTGISKAKSDTYLQFQIIFAFVNHSEEDPLSPTEKLEKDIEATFSSININDVNPELLNMVAPTSPFNEPKRQRRRHSYVPGLDSNT